MKKCSFTLVLTALLCLFLPEMSTAQPALKAKLSGRLLLDGISFLTARDTLESKTDIVDLRLAGKVSYGNWYGKFDIGFARNKVSIKDAYVQYSYKENVFRMGYMFGYWGLDQSFSTCDYLFNTGATMADMLYPGRRIGLSYTRTHPAYYLAAGAFMGDRLKVTSDTRQGFNTTFRGAWRPVNGDRKLVHLGASVYYRIPDLDQICGQSRIRLAASAVTYLPVPAFQDLTFINPHHQLESGVEFYAFCKKWMVQTEYMTTLILQQDRRWYRADGGYLMAGYLIKGEHFGYDQTDAVPMMPTDPKSLLLLVRYNASNLNDSHSGVFGGLQHDISIGLDYFFNPYISTRLNWSWVELDGHSALGKRSIHLIQTRLQFRF